MDFSEIDWDGFGAMDRVVFIAEEEGIVVLATDRDADIDEIREHFEFILRYPVRVDHINEHPHRRQELEMLIEKGREEMEEAFNTLAEFSAEADDEPSDDDPPTESGWYIT